MNYEVYELSESHQQILDETPEPLKVEVSLLDRDNLPLASGTAIIPLLLGVGMFWPDSPMPSDKVLAAARCFALATGERLKLKTLTLCTGSPPHYKFWVNSPFSSPALY